MTITDTELRIEGMNALLNALGEVQRCMTLIIRESFDYATWQRILWRDRSVREMSQAAME